MIPTDPCKSIFKNPLMTFFLFDLFFFNCVYLSLHIYTLIQFLSCYFFLFFFFIYLVYLSNQVLSFRLEKIPIIEYIFVFIFFLVIHNSCICIITSHISLIFIFLSLDLSYIELNPA